MKLARVITISVSVAFVCSCGGSNSDQTANNAAATVTNSSAANSAAVVPYTPSNDSLNPNRPANATVVTVPNVTKQMTVSAPDDSDYSASMDAKGAAVETRTFHNDKFISKVVRTWKTPTEKTIAIYLKSGKVVNLSGDQWPDIKGQPVENFYAAAGIKPPTSAKNEPSGEKTKEKSKPEEKQ